MKQLTLATAGFERYAKTTRRAMFLAEMERVVPWPALCALIEPFYPKPGSGRPPIGVERMLRIYLLQHWFNLSDPAVEEALYDSQAMRRFVGVDLGREPVPDETTVCRFRHLLEGDDFCLQGAPIAHMLTQPIGHQIGLVLWLSMLAGGGHRPTARRSTPFAPGSLLEETRFEALVLPHSRPSRSIPVRLTRVGALPLPTWLETRIGVWLASFYHPSGRL